MGFHLYSKFDLPGEVVAEQIFANFESVGDSSLVPGTRQYLVRANLEPRPLAMYGTREESYSPGKENQTSQKASMFQLGYMIKLT